jgi:hypothetical protein
MSMARIVGTGPSGGTAESGGAVGPSPAKWLGLAAAPTFAAMALWTALLSSPPDMCSAMRGSAAMNGMTLMYLLMSVFHASPWLKLILGRRACMSPAFGDPARARASGR